MAMSQFLVLTNARRQEDKRQYDEEKKNLPPITKCSKCRSSIVSEEMFSRNNKRKRSNIDQDSFSEETNLLHPMSELPDELVEMFGSKMKSADSIVSEEMLSRNNRRKRSNIDQDSLSEETTSLRPCPELPDEVIEMIGLKMKSADDCAHFRAVCMSWKDVFDNILRLSLPRQLPLLVCQKVCPFRLHHFPERGETRNSSKDMKLDNIPGWCIGSTEGWLVFIEPQGDVRKWSKWSSSSIVLVNPFRYEQIRLPTLQLGRVKKVAFSTNPTWNKDYVVMVIYGIRSMIAFCRSGDETWTKIGDTTFFQIDDVIWYRNQFHMIDHSGKLFTVSNISSSPVLECVAYKKIMVPTVQLYLVDLSGDLLLVHREVDKSLNTIWFEVFKMDPMERVFTRVTDLGDHLLFLGSISSVSVLASHFSGRNCSNRIYFGRDPTAAGMNRSALDMGYFCLSDRHIRQICTPEAWDAYFWIEPQVATSLK